MELERIGYLIAKYGDVSPKKNKYGVIYWSNRINNEQIKRENKRWTTFKQAKQDYYTYLDSEEKKIPLIAGNFKQIADEYLAYVKISNKLSTHSKEQSTINAHLLPVFKDYQVSEINLKVVQAFQSSLLEKTYTRNGKQHTYKNRTLEIIQICLRSILTFAANHGYIEKNPFDLTNLIQRNTIEIKEPMVIITQEQFDDFISVIDNQQDITMYNILFWCGLRFGEMLALNIGDYDRENRTLNIYKNYDPKNYILTTTKTGHNRVVTVPIKCANEIELLLSEYENDTGFLKDDFVLIGMNKRISQSIANKRKNAQIKLSNENNIDMPHFTFHSLRHSHVSILLQLNMTPHDISKRLGHSVEMVNETYGHLFPKKKQEIIDKLNSL